MPGAAEVAEELAEGGASFGAPDPGLAEATSGEGDDVRDIGVGGDGVDEAPLDEPVHRGVREGPLEAHEDRHAAADVAQRARPDEQDP